MGYEDTNKLKTQYMDDLVAQRQNMEDVMSKQNVEITEGEGLESMVEKVKTMEGMEVLPYYNFCNCYSTEMAKRVKNINFSTQTNFNYCFYNWKTCDLSSVNTINAKSMRYMLGSDVNRASEIITLGKNFRMDNVEDAQGFFSNLKRSTNLSQSGFAPILNMDNVVEQEAPKVTSLSYFLSGVDIHYTKEHLKVLNGLDSFFKKIRFPNVTDLSSFFQGVYFYCNATDEGVLGASKEFSEKLFGNYIDTSKVIDMSYMFYNTYSGNSTESMLPQILKNLNCSSVENAYYMFSRCTFLFEEKIDLSHLVMPKLNNVEYMFSNAVGSADKTMSQYIGTLILPTVPNETLKKIGTLFSGIVCFKTVDMSRINMGGVTLLGRYGFFNQTNKHIQDFYIGYNLGKGYTQQSSNYSAYTLALSFLINITRESVVYTFGKIYDLNLTYDVANGGNLYTQEIQLHSSTLAKLSAEDIEIATSKGWTVV